MQQFDLPCIHIIIFAQAKLEKKVLAKKVDKLTLIFNSDQVKALSRKSTKGMSWSGATVKKALKLRFSCGSTGYEEVRSTGMPLPSARTLRRRMQTIAFGSGVLTSVFSYMKIKVSHYDLVDALSAGHLVNQMWFKHQSLHSREKELFLSFNSHSMWACVLISMLTTGGPADELYVLIC